MARSGAMNSYILKQHYPQLIRQLLLDNGAKHSGRHSKGHAHASQSAPLFVSQVSARDEFQTFKQFTKISRNPTPPEHPNMVSLSVDSRWHLQASNNFSGGMQDGPVQRITKPRSLLKF